MNDYLGFVSACLAPVVAVVGLLFTWLQWRTTERERKNALFDRRFNFYTRLKQIYLSQHDEGNPPLTEEDWYPLAEEAGFLFGDDIERHISSLANRPVEGSPFFPNEWFVTPFRKYLRF